MSPIARILMILLCFAAVFASAYAQAQEQKSVKEILTGRNQVIDEKLIDPPARTIHGWQNVNSENVVLEFGESGLYLVELNKPCPILDSATGITMGHLGKTIYKGDSITIWGEGGPGIKGGKRIGNCQIDAVYRVENTGNETESGS